MAYELGLTPFSGSTGTLLSIGFETQQPYGNYSVSLLDPVLGNENSDNIITGHTNGMLTLASPEPQLTAFAQVVIPEDSSFVILLDSLQENAYDVNTAIEDLVWSFAADHMTIESSGENYLVIPDENWFGRDTIIVTAGDGLYEDQTILPVRVLNVNDLPMVVSDIPTQIFSEDGILTLDLSPYFFDADGELNFGITDHNENCQVTLIGQSLMVEPDTNWFGSGTVSVFATDLIDTVGTSFTFVVEAVNDPVISILEFDPVVITEDSAASVSLSGHFQDIDSDLVYTALSDSISLTATVLDTMLILVPDKDWFGETMIHVTAGDGQYESSLSFLILVNAVNDPPVQIDSIWTRSVNEDTELEIILNPFFEDVDSEIIYSAQSTIGQVTVSVYSDTLKIVPQTDWFGPASVFITFGDQEFSGVTELDLEVVPVNDPPTRSFPMADRTILEDNSLELDLDEHFNDIDSELIFTAEEVADLELVFTGPEMTISPGPDWFGSRYVFITASDLEYSVTDTFLLTISAVNDAPDEVSLISPASGSNLVSQDVTLDWHEPTDVDNDMIYTTLYIEYNDQTLSYSLDTIGYTFNVVEMQMPYDEPVNWWLSVTDGLLTTTSDIYQFTVPLSLRFNGPVWTISKRRDR